jgi:Fe-S-cluster containining protein
VESEEPDLAAGDFSAWITEMQGAIRGEHGSDVPCGECTACCTSSQFVHIEPDETDTLSYIPKELLFPAPQQPRGHVVMGYDERGHCPMLIDNRCSIYEHRPRTCRTYDCRVFPASGVEIDEADKALIAQRVRRWRFSYPTPADRNRHDAARAAAAFLAESGAGPATPRAVRAVEIHEAFLPRPFLPWHGDATVGAEDLPGDERRGIGDEVEDRPRDVLRFTDPPER